MKSVIKNVDLNHFQEKVSLAKLGHLDMPRKAYVKDMTILIDELKKTRIRGIDGQRSHEQFRR